MTAESVDDRTRNSEYSVVRIRRVGIVASLIHQLSGLSRVVDMSERCPDRRSMLFAGHVEDSGRYALMAVESLQTEVEAWPRNLKTPSGVAELLERSCQMFVDGCYTYENFFDAATTSLQAVEAALRERFISGDKPSLAQLTDRAHRSGFLDDNAREVLDAGRYLRNRAAHRTHVVVWPPALAAKVIKTSHELVAKLFACTPRN